MKNLNIYNKKFSNFIYYSLIFIPILLVSFKSIFLQCYIYADNPYIIEPYTTIINTCDNLIYYIAFPLIFFSFCFIIKNKWKLLFIGSLNFIFSFIMLLDITYYRGFYTFPSILVLNQTANLNNMGGTILSMFSIYDLLFFIDIFVWIFFINKFKYLFQRKENVNYKHFFICISISICITLYIPFNYYILGNTHIKNSNVLKINNSIDNLRVWGPIGYHIQDLIIVYNESKQYELTDEELEKINNYYLLKNENIPNNEYFGIFKDYNLLVIQVESLESFVLQKEYKGQKITPVLDELINTGIYFPNIFEQVNEGTSSDSDLMVNTSIFPLRRGSTFFRKPNTSYNSLPNILENNGYDTYAIHPDNGDFWNYREGHYGIGFDTFWDESTFKYDEELILGLSDESFFRQITPRISSMQDPFYTFAVTLTNHCPFNLPAEKNNLILDVELQNNKMGGYLQCVNYTDKQIGQFLSNLNNCGKLNNTLVVIIGDHTGIHKYYNHDIQSLSNPESWFLYDGDPKIPLIMWSKDKNINKTFNTIGGQIDIMPTILYSLGIDSNEYENTALGRNLLNTNKSFAITTDNKIHGEDTISLEEKQLQLDILELSDKMIRANYFK